MKLYYTFLVLALTFLLPSISGAKEIELIEFSFKNNKGASCLDWIQRDRQMEALADQVLYSGSEGSSTTVRLMDDYFGFVFESRKDSVELSILGYLGEEQAKFLNSGDVYSALFQAPGFRWDWYFPEYPQNISVVCENSCADGLVRFSFKIKKYLYCTSRTPLVISMDLLGNRWGLELKPIPSIFRERGWSLNKVSTDKLDYIRALNLL